jgi:hypothetical protein
MADRMRTRDRAFLRALVHRDYLALKPSILLAQVEFLAPNPDASFYVGFDYSDGRPSAHVHVWAPGHGLWDIDDNDPCTEEQHARASGRYMVQRVALSTGTAVQRPWIPLRTTSSALDDGVRRLARELQGIDGFVVKRSWLVEEIEKLDAETAGDLVEIH